MSESSEVTEVGAKSAVITAEVVEENEEEEEDETAVDLFEGRYRTKKKKKKRYDETRKRRYLTTDLDLADEDELSGDIKGPAYSEMLPSFDQMAKVRVQQRIKHALQAMNKNIEYQENCQRYALDGLRFHRLFLNGMSLNIPKVKDKLTKSERGRLESMFQ